MDRWRGGVFMGFETGTGFCCGISVCPEILSILINPVNPVHYPL